ncbi:MAG: SDR family oxidoreductase [Elusimicrobiota bacterium]
MAKRQFARVLVTGGAGYVGCVLVRKLLAAGYEVVVYDILYYGKDGLPEHDKLRLIEGDIRDAGAMREALVGVDAVIHLACISNDPSYDLDPELGKSINFDSFEPMVQASKAAGVKRFINVSSSSVYGISDAPEVTEEHPLNPLTDYSKYKLMCEEVLQRYREPGFCCATIRPATVCGYSPRLRLDLSINILTNLAYRNRKITVFGGTQKRPNIHIDDIVDLYLLLLELADVKIDGKVYNAGYENFTIAELAEMIRKVVEEEFPDKAPIEIATTPTDDLRSYHVCSRKIERELGFTPQRGLDDAVRGLCAAFKAGRIPDSLEDNRYFNVRTMKVLAAGKAAGA